MAYRRVMGSRIQPPRVKTIRDAARRGVPKANVGAAKDWASGQTAKEEVERNESPFIQEAIASARDGDDSMLLPYQPTPSINPPRPRTLAAGYDPDTKTMRVRFRGGAGYEYYNVSAQTWKNFRRVKSPGRAINRYFPKGSDYSRADW